MIQPSLPAASTRHREATPGVKHPWSGYYAALIQRLRGMRNGSSASPYALGVTSCSRHEGVTTVAANLAISGSRDPAEKVLLVDATAVNPSVAVRFNVEPISGFRSALQDISAVPGCIQSTSFPNVFLLTAGMAKDEDTYLVDRRALTALIEELKRTFSVIVFDLPIAHELTPCFALASALDGVLLVVEADRVDSEVAQRSKQGLVNAHANLVGVVLNKAR